ncbi:HD domain-containing protein [Halanaerobium saccharolyticum]|uniref:HD domain-containing protein n=1 Tax=Halanaerobium saccharolyticum TaxID=43595 RepID=A0A2T5RGZ4_9FIRM|nr:HD domain-containing protein [Halanaerobium saccharolyticum]PTV94469.1 HD domain-containing protein [Halanaerobium saccharolyticum]
MNLEDFIIKALSSKKPSLYFKNNKKTGKEIFPALYKLKSVPEMKKYHFHDNTFDHLMMIIDYVAAETDEINVLFAALMHDIGKLETEEDILPHHYAHEKVGLEKLCEIAEGKLPPEYIDSAKVVIRYHMMIKNWNQLRPGTIVDMFNAIYYSPLLIEDFLIIIKADNMNKKNKESDIPYDEIAKLYENYVEEFDKLKDRNAQSLFIAGEK